MFWIIVSIVLLWIVAAGVYISETNRNKRIRGQMENDILFDNSDEPLSPRRQADKARRKTKNPLLLG